VAVEARAAVEALAAAPVVVEAAGLVKALAVGEPETRMEADFVAMISTGTST